MMQRIQLIVLTLLAQQLGATEFAPTRTIGVTQIQEQSNLQLKPGFAPYIEHEGTKLERRNVNTRTEEEELYMKHARDENEVQIAARIESPAKKIQAKEDLEGRSKKVAERLKALNEKVFETSKNGGLAYETARRERDAFLASVSSQDNSLMPP